VDTSYYFFAGYAALWLIPTIFIVSMTKRLLQVDKSLKNALTRIGVKDEGVE